MSLIIWEAFFFDRCLMKRYSSTQDTRWSLNPPFITWWRRSGDNSSWISARGKSFVKGWNESQPSIDQKQIITYNNISNNTVVIPQYCRIEWTNHAISPLFCPTKCGAIEIVKHSSASKSLWGRVGKQKSGIPWTPVIDNACKQDLLWIISYVWSKTIHNMPIMSIWAFPYLRWSHSWA